MKNGRDQSSDASARSPGEADRIRSLPRIATMATMPSRRATFEITLADILPQVDRLVVFLDGFDEIPEALRDRERVSVLRSQDTADLHGAGRFLMLRDLDRPAIVICVDDDIFYADDHVERLVDGLVAAGGRALVGFHGTVFTPPYRSYLADIERLQFSESLAADRIVDELGAGTVAFLSDVLDFDVRAWPRTDAGDLCMAIEAKKRGLPLVCLARSADWMRPQAMDQDDSVWVATKRDPAPKSALMRSLICEEPGSGGSTPVPTWIVPKSALAGSRPEVPRGPSRDVYLQPHCDDVCFSLGGRASRLEGGLLLTVFSTNGYTAPKVGAPPCAPEVGATLRKAEDAAFAAACGLDLRFMDLPSATELGLGSFDLDHAEAGRRRIDARLTAQLLAHADAAEARPWLFCPAAIGGHVDHAAVFETVLTHWEALSSRYRIAFYEDLPYAAEPRRRSLGIARMKRRAAGLNLRRGVFPLDRALATRKVDTISLYPSQIEEIPDDLRSFAPATRPRTPDHEAIWSVDPHPDALPDRRAVAFVDGAFRLFDRLAALTRNE